MATDLDGDGMCELIVVFLLENGTYSLEIHNTKSCTYDYESTIGCSFEYFNTNDDLFDGMTSLPFLLDPSGDGHVRIFSFFNRSRYTSTLQDTGRFDLKSFGDLMVTPVSDFPQVTKHFASIIDVDGNC